MSREESEPETPETPETPEPASPPVDAGAETPPPSPTPFEPAAPTREGERIASIDVVRGFALGGVLLMNMQAFAGIFAAYMNPTADGGYHGASKWLWNVNHVLADQRFISIFSLLFGAGVLLMTRRLEERTGRSAAVHYRRMLWLGLFGAAHAYLLWFGDILLPYAISGLLLWPCRRWRPSILLLVGTILVVATALLSLGMDGMLAEAPPEEIAAFEEMWEPDDAQIAETVAAYRGGWLEQMPERVAQARDFHAWLPFFVWRLIGLMLIGMALLKTGFLAARKAPALYLGIGVVGVVSGAVVSWLGIEARVERDWELAYSMGEGSLYNTVGATLGAFGWLGLILWVCAVGRWAGVRRRLAAVGRMAFTNYLMQTVICTTLFYGHGLGWYGSVDRPGQLAVFVVVFGLQLAWSPWWLARFRMGPMEWVWRALTYLRLPPLRRDAARAE
ncbi:MAG: DUF418 domain-containing protein [Planctomycetota bacterium JB042]